MAPPPRTLAACALALLSSVDSPPCGANQDEIGVEEPAREGLAVNIGGLDYNVFITRELNLAITPDKDYYGGPPANRATSCSASSSSSATRRRGEGSAESARVRGPTTRAPSSSRSSSPRTTPSPTTPAS